MPDHAIKRFQIDIPADELERMDEHAKECGFATKKELITNSLVLHEWCIEEAKRGCKIFSFDPKTKKSRELVTPALIKVGRSAT